MAKRCGTLQIKVILPNGDEKMVPFVKILGDEETAIADNLLFGYKCGEPQYTMEQYSRKEKLRLKELKLAILDNPKIILRLDENGRYSIDEEANKEKAYLKQSAVHKLGFTNTMIDDMLPAPILTKHPYDPHGTGMKMWKKSDVLKVMETDQFKTALAKRNNRI